MSAGCELSLWKHKRKDQYACIDLSVFLCVAMGILSDFLFENKKLSSEYKILDVAKFQLFTQSLRVS